MALKRVYWDTCVWLGLMNQEPDKLARCEHVLHLARLGEVEIWTSALTLAEVFKITVEGRPQRLPDNADVQFEEYVEQDFVVVAQVDIDTGRMARRLLRSHTPLKKPPDAIHLATAVINNLDEFHTFDGVNIIPLNGVVNRADGAGMVICLPPEPPPLIQPELVEYENQDDEPNEALDTAALIEDISEAAVADAPEVSDATVGDLVADAVEVEQQRQAEVVEQNFDNQAGRNA